MSPVGNMSQILSPIQAENPHRSLRALLRNPPELAPGDSLHRFVQLLRFEPIGALPVTENGRLVGIISHADLVPALRSAEGAARSAEMQRPVADFMRPPTDVLRANMSPSEAAALFSETGRTMLPVLDDRDYYQGAVAAHDLLVPELPAPRPARIGGMATPFGVYLTDGTVQAGVGNLALMCTGLVMTSLWLLAVGGLTWVFQAVSWLLKRPIPLLLLLGDDAPPRNVWLGLAGIGESLLLFVLFMILMRFTRLAGYHAAEHQTVHAIERYEVLTPSAVARMPRAHPRCGTNLMAAVFVFFTVKQALIYVPALGGMDVPMIVAAVATLFVWRPIGTFLQERFTTKPADERELASGIKAGKALLERYLESPPSRPSLARRVWCSGMIQVMLGASPVWVVPFLLPYADSLRRLVIGH